MAWLNWLLENFVCENLFDFDFCSVGPPVVQPIWRPDLRCSMAPAPGRGFMRHDEQGEPHPSVGLGRKAEGLVSWNQPFGILLIYIRAELVA